MLIPATTVPVTIIGAFAAMAALGFSVNLSTLFAIVLAIGIVVDDAIVIVEGVAHHIERGLTPHDAADQGDGRTVRADHRHHAGADVGVHPGGVHAGPDRQDVRAVRAGDRRDRAAERHQCRDAETDAGRAVDARAGAAGKAQHLLSLLQPRLRRAGARLCPADRPDGVGEHGVGRHRAADRRGRALWPHARRVGLHPDRGSGLSGGRRAAARRGLARAHAEGDGSGRRDRQEDAGRRSGRDRRGHLAARQFGFALQRGRRLRDAQALEPARQGGGPAVAVHRHEPRHAGGDGRARAGGAAAADPGRRQCVGLHHADRAARRQLRLPQAARPRERHGRGGHRPDRASSA